MPKASSAMPTSVHCAVRNRERVGSVLAIATGVIGRHYRHLDAMGYAAKDAGHTARHGWLSWGAEILALGAYKSTFGLTPGPSDTLAAVSLAAGKRP